MFGYCCSLAVIQIQSNSNIRIVDRNFEDNSGLMIYTSDDTTMVLKDSIFISNTGIISAVEIHNNNENDTTLFENIHVLKDPF